MKRYPTGAEAPICVVKKERILATVLMVSKKCVQTVSKL